MKEDDGGRKPEAGGDAVEGEQTEVTLEGAWDCPNCGTKGLRGSFKCCSNCGKPRGDDVEFYLPDNARVVDKEEELRIASLGPDWRCQYCGANNRADFPFCTGCGAPGANAPKRDVIEEKLEKKPPVNPPPPPPSKKPPLAWILGGCAFVSLFFLIIFSSIIANLPKDMMATVSGHGWERCVEIEGMRTVRESGWENEVPAQARTISRSREIHHNDRVQSGTVTKTRTVHDRVQTGTQRVKVGKKNMGNGYFKEIYEERPVYKDVSKTENYQEPVYRDVPVYKFKVTYEIDKWVVRDGVKRSGNDRNAVWPDARPGFRERLGNRKETYYVYFKGDKGEDYTYKTENHNDWLSCEMGKRYKVSADRSGNVRKVTK